MASICAFDEDVFVWTEDGYKNYDSFDPGVSRVGSVVRGELELVDAENMFIESYTGPMIRVSNTEGTLVAITPSQRIFWIDHAGAIQIGTGQELYENFGRFARVFLITADNSRVAVSRVQQTMVKDHLVWGFQTTTGNLVIKSQGTPLVFSDCG